MRIIRVVAAVIGSDNKIFDTAQEDIVNLKVNGNSQVESLFIPSSMIIQHFICLWIASGMRL